MWIKVGCGTVNFNDYSRVFPMSPGEGMAHEIWGQRKDSGNEDVLFGAQDVETRNETLRLINLSLDAKEIPVQEITEMQKSIKKKEAEIVTLKEQLRAATKGGLSTEELSGALSVANEIEAGGLSLCGETASNQPSRRSDD